MHNVGIERVACPRGASISLLQRRDIQVDAGEIIDHDLGGRTALQRGKSFDVTETALARLDHRMCAAFLLHERHQLFVVRHAAVRARQTQRLPSATAAAAAQIAAALDASHFGKGRPRTAHGAISCHPTLRNRWRPPAVARLQERDWREERHSLERVRVYAEIDGGLLQPLAILAQRECEEIDGIHALLLDAPQRR